MEAIGNQVLWVVALPLLAIVGVVLAEWKQIRAFSRELLRSDVRIEENQEERHHREDILGDDTCSICLGSPKVHTASATCGHSFCGECIFNMFRTTRNKLKCPLCRKEVTTIFKIFNLAPGEPQEDAQKVIEQIREYNRLFDDNRPLLRRIIQLPYVFRRIVMFIWRPDFLVYFFRSVQLIRLIFLCMIYILLPLDLIPEMMLGWIGFVDDVLIVLLLVAFFMTMAALQYMRHRGH